ncbi:MAG: putative peptide zinc metalloprotease protein [Porticoccaceae bacterium]
MTQPALDSSTRELLHSRICLRTDLVFIPRRGRWKEWYQIEARHSGRYFRIGVTEYAFMSLLDGDTTIGEAVSLTARRYGPDAFSEDQATSIVVWLLENDLAEVCEVGAAGKQNSNATTGRRKTTLVERLNPFWLKLPFGNPDAFINKLLPLTSWLHSWAAIIVSCVIWIAAAIAIASNWSSFESSWSTVLHRSNWVWLGASWLFLKIVHELSHAVACRRHGGEVRDSGIIFILLAPVAYVDVTSSLSFPSRWQRIQTAAAGIYVELTIASLAAIAWTVTDSPLLSHHLVNLIWSASVTTIVFNANPLMKFDGYYILSDLLDRPNLYTDSAQHLQRIANRIFFGVKTGSVRSSNQDAMLTATYGAAAFVWRMLICVGLLISASVMFHGAGIVLAAAGVLLWFGRPILQLVRKLWLLTRLDPQKSLRATVLGTASLAALGALLFLTPWPAGATAPGILDHQDLAVVRAETPGFVRRIHVADGEQVAEGQLLIELENEELANEVADIKVAIQQSDIRRSQSIRNHETAAAQVEAENRAALQKRLTEKLQQAEALTVRAPIAGRVMSRSLVWAEGTYAQPGTELVAIGDDSRKELRVSISQDDARWLQSAAEHSNGTTTVNVRLRSVGLAQGTVRRILPGATRTPLHASLTAPAGGPLVVKANSSSDSKSEFVLTEPRVTAIVDLPPEVAASIPAGSVGHVWLKTAQAPTIAEATTRIATRWIEAQLDSARAE